MNVYLLNYTPGRHGLTRAYKVFSGLLWRDEPDFENDEAQQQVTMVAAQSGVGGVREGL